MNYLAEILAFNNWIECNSQINKSEICLWHSLMHIANGFAWSEFTVPISKLILQSKLNKDAIYRARNKLKQLGFIDFKERGGNQYAVYKMNSVVSQYGTQNAIQSATINIKRYQVQIGILNELEKTIKDEGILVTKEYVKGRKNVYSHPAISDYNRTTDSANKTVITLMKIITTLRDNQNEEESDPLLEILSGCKIKTDN